MARGRDSAGRAGLEGGRMDIETLVRTLDDEAADDVRAVFAEFEAFGGGDSDAVTVQAALRNSFPIATRYFRSTSAGIATFHLEYEEHDSGGSWQIHTRFVPWRGVMGAPRSSGRSARTPTAPLWAPMACGSAAPKHEKHERWQREPPPRWVRYGLRRLHGLLACLFLRFLHALVAVFLR